MSGEHPAKYVVEMLADPAIFEPVKQWVVEKAPAFCLPGGSVVPVFWLTLTYCLELVVVFLCW